MNETLLFTLCVFPLFLLFIWGRLRPEHKKEYEDDKYGLKRLTNPTPPEKKSIPFVLIVTFIVSYIFSWFIFGGR